MREQSVGLDTMARRSAGATPGFRRGRTPETPEETRRFFLDHYPLLLDGVLPCHAGASRFLHEACATLARGGADTGLMPAALLRETLDSLSPTPHPATRAGMTAVGPRRVRVWWDRALLGDLDDILAAVDRPRLVLRFYDVTGLDPDGERWNNLFDIDAEAAEQGKSVDFWSPDRVYVVDLGLIYADGRFQALARTNTAEIPREARGNKHPGKTARSAIVPRDIPAVVPGREDYAWAASRPDSPNRDIEAEALMRRLYRLFLEEGPRALRRAAVPVRRPEAALRREFEARGRERRECAAPPAVRPRLLVARLDRPADAADAPPARFLPAPSPWARVMNLVGERGEYFARLAPLLRSGGVAETAPGAARRERELVAPVVDAAGLEPLLADAAPVFEAAERLGARLAGLTAAATDRDASRPESPRRESAEPAGQRDFGGLESRRFARAGVRLTRVALTLEGRMRPGARLKVAGRLVYPDADGRFRLECVLGGKRTRIPLSAGPSTSGEVRGVVNVDWQKRTRDARPVN